MTKKEQESLDVEATDKKKPAGLIRLNTEYFPRGTLGRYYFENQEVGVYQLDGRYRPATTFEAPLTYLFPRSRWVAGMIDQGVVTIEQLLRASRTNKRDRQFFEADIEHYCRSLASPPHARLLQYAFRLTFRTSKVHLPIEPQPRLPNQEASLIQAVDQALLHLHPDEGRNQFEAQLLDNLFGLTRGYRLPSREVARLIGKPQLTVDGKRIEALTDLVFRSRHALRCFITYLPGSLAKTLFAHIDNVHNLIEMIDTGNLPEEIVRGLDRRGLLCTKGQYSRPKIFADRFLALSSPTIDEEGVRLIKGHVLAIRAGNESLSWLPSLVDELCRVSRLPTERARELLLTPVETLGLDYATTLALLRAGIDSFGRLMILYYKNNQGLGSIRSYNFYNRLQPLHIKLEVWENIINYPPLSGNK